MSVQDILDFIDKLHTVTAMREITDTGRAVHVPGAKVFLFAQLTAGPPIQINIHNEVYKDFWRDLARQGVGEVGEFEQVEYRFAKARTPSPEPQGPPGPPGPWPWQKKN